MKATGKTRVNLEAQDRTKVEYVGYWLGPLALAPSSSKLPKVRQPQCVTVTSSLCAHEYTPIG